MRAYKTVNDAYIEPISFTVPRRAETFQADIFPPAFGTKPALSAQEWLDGKTATPSKIDLESVYEGTAPKEVASDYKPPAAVQATPVSKPAPPKEEPKREEPKPVVSRAPPPSMNEQKGSMSAIADKFQNKDDSEEEEDEDETSSFEEISRPQPRSSMPIRSEPKPAPAAAPAPIKTASPVRANPPSSTPTPTATSVAPSSGVESSLDQIKQLLENQTRIITAQNDRIGQLTAEVDAIKRKMGSSSQDQSERIRQLELELEEARS